MKVFVINKTIIEVSDRMMFVTKKKFKTFCHPVDSVWVLIFSAALSLGAL